MTQSETNQLSELLEASIEMELLVSDLYALYSEVFKDDREFWWRLSLEEKNHAALLKSGRLYLKVGRLSPEVVTENMKAIQTVCATLRERTATYSKAVPGRLEAYRLAHAIENTAAEAHFQRMMTMDTNDKIVNIFKSLGGEDHDHAQRIGELIKKHGL